MNSKNLDILLENQSLKNEFALRNLDLAEVWRPTPDNLELENRQLRHLLEWVDKYLECRDREKMEAQGYKFPPINFCIDPESDWYRFKRWIHAFSGFSKTVCFPQSDVTKNIAGTTGRGRPQDGGI